MRWGVAEFAAAEEMDRFRGYWWAPDGTALLATRVDDTPVQRWWIADPAHPDRRPTEVAYPAAGTPNADVTAWIVRARRRRARRSRWDRDDLPYLAEAAWDDHGPLLALHPRDQRRHRGARRRPALGRHRGAVDRPRRRVGGASARARPPGSPTVGVVVCSDADGRRRLVVGGTPVTPDDLHVRAVAHVGDDRSCSPPTRSTTPPAPPCGAGPTTGSSSSPPTTASTRAVVGGDTVVVRRVSLDATAPEITIKSGSAFVFGSIATAITGFGKLDPAPARSVRSGVRQRVAGGGVLEAHAGDSVARVALLDLLAVVCVHHPAGGPRARCGRWTRSAPW